MIVACVLRSGGVYGPEYVYALERAVARHLGGYQFVCLTDMELGGIETVPLVHGWPGWWSKMEMFRPWLFFGPVLSIDLDTIVTGDLGDIAAVDRLTILADFYNWKQGRFGSGLMMTTDEARERAWFAFARDPHRHMGENKGDQDFLEQVWAPLGIAAWQDIVPGQIVSYKVDEDGQRRTLDACPDNARVVCFHGRPKPHEVTDWAGEVWRVGLS